MGGLNAFTNKSSNVNSTVGSIPTQEITEPPKCKYCRPALSYPGATGPLWPPVAPCDCSSVNLNEIKNQFRHIWRTLQPHTEQFKHHRGPPGRGMWSFPSQSSPLK